MANEIKKDDSNNSMCDADHIPSPSEMPTFSIKDLKIEKAENATWNLDVKFQLQGLFEHNITYFKFDSETLFNKFKNQMKQFLMGLVVIEDDLGYQAIIEEENFPDFEIKKKSELLIFQPDKTYTRLIEILCELMEMTPMELAKNEFQKSLDWYWNELKGSILWNEAKMPQPKN